MNLVIIGNGVAGMEAAITARSRDETARITLVSEESERHFSRTALMYVLSGQLSYRDIEPHPRDLEDRLGIARVRGHVAGLDTARRQVRLAQGPPLPYDRLIVACGSKPRPAPWDGAGLAGIGHFVTLQDLRWLELCLHGRHGVDLPERHEATADAPASSPYRLRPVVPRPKHPVVIGGGLIGIEVVECLLAAGLRPAFLWREDWFWSLALGRREGDWIAERLRDHGVEVLGQAEMQGFRGGERVEAVRVSGREIPCDLAVVAIGVVPNTTWLGDALRLEPSGGIAVDEQLRASAPEVWAAGDCAAVPQPDGGRRPETLWYTGRAQGRIAGRNATEDGATYQRGPAYNAAKLMDCEYTTAGSIDGLPAPGAREWWHEERGAVRSTLRIALDAEDRVLGFNGLGRRWDHAVWLRWIHERRRLGWVLDHLHESSFDTELVPRLRIPPGSRPAPS